MGIEVIMNSDSTELLGLRSAPEQVTSYRRRSGVTGRPGCEVSPAAGLKVLHAEFQNMKDGDP
jgi:hypothetical protein